MINNPILSICIPIYNRLEYLRKMLTRFHEDRELFNRGEIQLFISDNCSLEDILGCVNEFREQGLLIEFHRNNSNLGMDGNFASCFRNARGKYVWLLGSDDIPDSGKVKSLLEILRNNDLNALYLTNRAGNGDLNYFKDPQAFLKKISILITFISCNIVSNKFVSDIDFEKYNGTLLTQLPLYLSAITASEGECAIYNSKIFGDLDRKSGGYNIFDVFIKKFLGIYKEFVERGNVSKDTYKTIRFDMFRRFVCPHAFEYIFCKKCVSFDFTDAWSIIRNEYSTDAYFYYYPIWSLIKVMIKKII